MPETEARLIAQILCDPTVQVRFEHDQEALLREWGIGVPPGVKLMLVEDPAHARHYFVPYPADRPEAARVTVDRNR